jgi:ribosomal protein S11
MRKKAARAARRDAARAWIEYGAKKVHVRTYARRFGVDRYTAYQHLLAIGFPLTPEEERWPFAHARSRNAESHRRPLTTACTSGRSSGANESGSSATHPAVWRMA